MAIAVLHCSNFVPIDFLVIRLIILRFFVNQIANKKRELNMKHKKRLGNEVKL